MTWGELIRRLRKAGWSPLKTGKRSHQQFTKGGRVITIAVHTKKEVGAGLAHKILKEAGL